MPGNLRVQVHVGVIAPIHVSAFAGAEPSRPPNNSALSCASSHTMIAPLRFVGGGVPICVSPFADSAQVSPSVVVESASKPPKKRTRCSAKSLTHAACLRPPMSPGSDQTEPLNRYVSSSAVPLDDPPNRSSCEPVYASTGFARAPPALPRLCHDVPS